MANFEIIGAGKKLVLDACCGGRMFWYNKQSADTVFTDIRQISKGAFANGWNPNWCVVPDTVSDFRNLPFKDGCFKLIIFDPPHLTSGSAKSVINTKYGLLNKQTWQQDIVEAFTECWRVLETNGILIFKWNAANIRIKDLIALLPNDPLFGDFTGKTGATVWMTFLKMPAQKNIEVCHTSPNTGSMPALQESFEDLL
jgi:SAM-dependent methyltransferase